MKKRHAVQSIKYSTLFALLLALVTYMFYLADVYKAAIIIKEILLIVQGFSLFGFFFLSGVFGIFPFVVNMLSKETLKNNIFLSLFKFEDEDQDKN